LNTNFSCLTDKPPLTNASCDFNRFDFTTFFVAYVSYSVLEKVSSYVELLYEFDIEHMPIRQVAASHGWSWSISYEEKHSKQVRQFLEPIETWMTDAGLTNVRARSLGIFSLYYIGYREAVIRQASASDCLKMIRTSLSYFCV